MFAAALRETTPQSAATYWATFKTLPQLKWRVPDNVEKEIVSSLKRAKKAPEADLPVMIDELARMGAVAETTHEQDVVGALTTNWWLLSRGDVRALRLHQEDVQTRQRPQGGGI